MSAPFRIAAESGRVSFPDISLEVYPLMPESEFVAVTARLNRDNLGGNDGWQRYSIRELISQDRKIGIFFVFLHQKLKMLGFAYAPKDETWADWSEATERARQEEYRQELASQLGGKSTLPWGTANAQLDSKSGGTDVWIHFSDPTEQRPA